MQFIDEAKIFVKSGDGGAGCVSFRREANVPKGGPDGGNGGRGGSVIIQGVPGLNTLIDFRFQQHFKAKKGDHGQGRNRNGASAKDLIIDVPVGTQVIDDNTGDLIIDIDAVDKRYVLAQGGQGGLGNTNFKSSINQAPKKATNGTSGEECWVWLKLKLLSDSGLVGLPNAGKSTFVSSVSRARPKIADYPFTTIRPQLGVVYVDDREFVIADIPGLIKGAHQGQGLGDQFLKHIERCGVLLHLIDGTEEDVVQAYRTIREELAGYNDALVEKEEILALNKIDALTEDEIEAKRLLLEQESGKKVYLISAVTQMGVEVVKRILLEKIKQLHNAGVADDTSSEPSGYSPI